MPLSALRLLRRSILVYGCARVAVGKTVFLAIAAIVRRGGRLPAAHLCRLVWGARPVTAVGLRALALRITRKLAAVGYPGRCGLDGGDVLIC